MISTNIPLIRPLYKGADNKIRRGYHSHIDHCGVPLCKFKNRNNALAKWVAEQGLPTCPICLSRYHKGDVAS